MPAPEKQTPKWKAKPPQPKTPQTPKPKIPKQTYVALPAELVRDLRAAARVIGTSPSELTKAIISDRMFSRTWASRFATLLFRVSEESEGVPTDVALEAIAIGRELLSRK